MQVVTTIGLDIAKSVFQVHGVGSWAPRATRHARAISDTRLSLVSATTFSSASIARMAWAMMARGERYKEPVALAR